MLTIQYRMHPQIVIFPSQQFYDNKIQNNLNIGRDCRNYLCTGVETTAATCTCPLSATTTRRVITASGQANPALGGLRPVVTPLSPSGNDGVRLRRSIPASGCPRSYRQRQSLPPRGIRNCPCRSTHFFYIKEHSRKCNFVGVCAGRLRLYHKKNVSL